MIVDTLLLLNSTVVMAMALALLPAVWFGRGGDAGVRYWAWGCVAIAWSWLAKAWGIGLPLDSAAMLADGLQVLGAALFAQGVGADRRARLNPLWPIGLLVAGYAASLLLPSLWPARGLFVAIIIAWIAWRTGVPLLSAPTAARRSLGVAFLLFGLLAVNIAIYRFFSGNLAGVDEEPELIIAMLELTAVVFLTISYLVARAARSHISPAPPTYDAVTGCLDRASINRRLAQEFARGDPPDEPLTIFMIDLDHLKEINDTRGHPAGDEALRIVVTALARVLRAADGIGRYGGDEFLAILPRTTAAQAGHVTERVRTALAELDGGHQPLTVSVGVAERHQRDSPETLVARADVALYTAKHRGRNQAATVENQPSAPRVGEGEMGRGGASPSEEPTVS